MKRRLELLIRVQTQTLDENRQRLARLEIQLQIQLQKLRDLNAEVSKEKTFTAHHLKYSYTWRDYLKTAQTRERQILLLIEQINRNISWERQSIQKIFEKLKACEIAKDELVAHEYLAQSQAEQKLLDEVALNQYIRKDT